MIFLSNWSAIWFTIFKSKSMRKRQFSIDDIQIGDEILFNDEHKVHHNIFWRVVNKLSNNRLIVEIKEMGYAEKIIVAVKDVINLHRNNMAYWSGPNSVQYGLWHNEVSGSQIFNKKRTARLSGAAIITQALHIPSWFTRVFLFFKNSFNTDQSASWWFAGALCKFFPGNWDYCSFSNFFLRCLSPFPLNS